MRHPSGVAQSSDRCIAAIRPTRHEPWQSSRRLRAGGSVSIRWVSQADHVDPVLGSSLIDELERLDQRRAQRFLAALLGAEISLLRAPLTHFRIANDERVRDGGIDAWLDVPAGAATPFPRGKTIWQFKTGASKPRAATELAVEKKAARDEIEAGADYALVWTGSPPPGDQKALENEFTAAVQQVRAGARAHILFGPQLSVLALRHPSVASIIDSSGLTRMYRWEKWRSMLPGVDIPFLEDGARTEVREAIVALATGEAPDYALHILGNAGVGKSRLVLESLGVEGLRERVLYARGPDRLPTELAAWTASRGGRRTRARRG